MAVLGLLPLIVRAVLLPVIPIPKPGIQDEFSYLLAADTFSSGRLTNPSPALWIHFETIHENLRPTYQSKYPPLQGLILAFGQVVFGHPWFGVWLSVGAMCAALYWAFIAWLPPKWSLLAGALATVHIGLLSYWSESYWGGAAAAIGGTLLVGAVPRLRTKFSGSTACLFAVGLAMLANSRPYEGLILAVAATAALILKVPHVRFVRAVAAILIPVALWMLYYNYRSTGHPLLMPYVANEQQYSNSSQFMWNTELAPRRHYNHEAIRAAWEDWTVGQRTNVQKHPLATHVYDASVMMDFFLGWPLGVCSLVMIWPALRSFRIRLAAVMLVIFIAGVELEVILIPHYVAPATALIWIVAVGALRRLWRSSRVAAALVLACSFVVYANQLKDPSHRWLYDKRDFIAHRDSVLQELAVSPGRHLVLVDFGPHHDVNHEWVYNAADIDRSRIVWAREMGDAKDRELIDYYPGRNIWRLLDDGPKGVTLSPIIGPR